MGVVLKHNFDWSGHSYVPPLFLLLLNNPEAELLTYIRIFFVHYTLSGSAKLEQPELLLCLRMIITQPNVRT